MSTADPHLVWLARYQAASAALDSYDLSDEEADRPFALLRKAEDALSETMPVSLAGAAAQIRYVIISMEGRKRQQKTKKRHKC